MPMFDIRDAAGVMTELNAAARPFPTTTSRSTRSIPRAGGSRCGCRSSSAGPPPSPDSRWCGEEGPGRSVRYTTRSYATERPEGERY